MWAAFLLVIRDRRRAGRGLKQLKQIVSVRTSFRFHGDLSLIVNQQVYEALNPVMDRSNTRAQAREQQDRVHGSVEVDRHGRVNQEARERPDQKARRKPSTQQIDYDFYLSD